MVDRNILRVACFPSPALPPRFPGGLVGGTATPADGDRVVTILGGRA